MSRREDVDSGIWGDPDFLDLTADAKLLYVWSFTNPLCNMAGVYRVGERTMMAQTGLAESRVRVAFAELCQRAFWVYERPLLWVRSRVKHLRSKGPTMARSVITVIVGLDPTHPIRQAFLDRYGGETWLRTEVTERVSESLKVDTKTDTPLKGVTGQGQGKEVVVSSKATQQGEVDELPTELRQTFEQVWPLLEEVAQAKQARLTVRAVASSLSRHSDRDPVSVAESFRYWHLHGNGENKPLKNAAQGFDTFLRTSRSSTKPSTPDPDYSAYDAVIRN